MKYLLVIGMGLLSKFGFSQIRGCTDPLASNYNASAVLNDGSCQYSATTIKPYSSVKLQNQLSEISGLLRYENDLWGHNDNSDCRLYRIDSQTGFVKGAMRMKMGLNRDWQDVSSDDSLIYVGDFGNNFKGNRKDLTIYLWNKSSIGDSFNVADSIRFYYPEQTDYSEKSPNSTNFDCEAMVVVGDSIVLFNKEWGTKNTSIYRLWKRSGSHRAEKIGVLSVDGLITGAAYNPKFNSFVLLGYSDLLQPFVYLIYDLKGLDFQRCNQRKILLDLPFYQTEAVEWMDTYKIAVGNERFSNSFINTAESLQFFNLSLLLGEFYGRSLNLNNFEEVSNMRFEIAQNPGTSNGASRLIVRGLDRCLLVQQQVYIMSESGVKLETLSMRSNSLDLPLLSPGVYLVGNGELGYVKWVVQ